jgi:hypothetical protein
MEELPMKYTIMQSTDRDLRFMNLRYTEAHGGVKPESYEAVYSGEISGTDIAEILERLYYKFNMEHPEDFRGHSMSVSDIVILSDDNGSTTHFCDSFGFKQIDVEWPADNEESEGEITDMKPETIEKLAFEIRDFLLKHELWQDVRIYFNGKALSTDDGNGHYAYNDPDTVFVLENKDPRRYFNYVGDYLSMSFEGPFYEVLNYYAPASYCDKINNEFLGILGKYGLYYELGNAWNLSLYPA